MISLRESENALAEYERAEELYKKATSSARLAGRNTAHKNLIDKRLLLGDPEALRTLLAVAQNALALKSQIALMNDEWFTDKEFEAKDKLLEDLKALED